MSEKFCLQWNDFQSSVSQSFIKLRTESHFNDVTLVSEDDVQMTAHKVVLSASSSFFRKILIDNPHANPLLYLGGVSSHNLSLVLDYIYQGKVQIYQEHLDGFLELAQKLKIEGLLEKPERNIVTDKCKDDEAEVKEDLTTVHSNQIYEEKARVNYAMSLGDQDKDMLVQKRKELYQRTTEGKYECLGCGKFMNNQANMMRHVETHIEGLSFNCKLCGKIFRSSNLFYKHRFISHKSS